MMEERGRRKEKRWREKEVLKWEKAARKAGFWSELGRDEPK